MRRVLHGSDDRQQRNRPDLLRWCCCISLPMSIRRSSGIAVCTADAGQQPSKYQATIANIGGVDSGNDQLCLGRRACPARRIGTRTFRQPTAQSPRINRYAASNSYQQPVRAGGGKARWALCQPCQRQDATPLLRLWSWLRRRLPRCRPSSRPCDVVDRKMDARPRGCQASPDPRSGATDQT